MMKKIIYAVVLLIAIFIAGNTTEAAIQKEDLNIDGIYMDQSMSEVFARYGKPDRVENSIPVGKICVYNINGGELRVSATSAEERGTVEGVTIIGNTGLATKTGIKVGSNAEEIIKVYGGKVTVHSPEPKMPEVTRTIGYSIIIKRDIKHNPAYAENRYQLWFYLNDDNKVVRISFWRDWSSE